MSELLCFGLGYSAQALARRLDGTGMRVRGTSRTAAGVDELRRAGFETLLFDGVAPSPDVTGALATASHVLVSIAPDADGDPVLRHHGDDIARAQGLGWIGYLSTIGVYGDAGGAWVDEETPPTPNSPRTERRVEAEAAWLALGRHSGKPVQIFRLGGIYGPGRSALDDVAAGTARRIIKPGQVFNRIYVADIAAVVAAAMSGGRPGEGRHALFNVTDEEPAPPQDVILYAAKLLGVAPPPEVAFEDAPLSPMARSFYSANRRVASRRIRDDLGVRLIAPTYREGLALALAAMGKAR